MRSAILFPLLLAASALFAQPYRPHQESRHGWHLSPHGTIRVLVLFAEIEWDLTPDKDPQPQATERWPKGELPTWRDDLFDPHPMPVPQAMVSRYYHDISLGNYVVMGDYMDRLVKLRQSEYPGITAQHGINRLVVTEANKFGELRTRHGLGVDDFDLWKRGGRPGQPKEQGPDDPHSYDHVMVILRNSPFTHGQGSVDAGSPGKLFGHESDSQSRFGGMNALPFEILKHEYNHLLLGGNNFHSGGGNAAVFLSFFPFLQGGWSMMGAAFSSLLTCSAWDRDRLDWKSEGATHRIRARDTQGREVDGDLDPLDGDTGVFVLRDFVPSGDALRIRMPFLADELHQQWLWIENHQGFHRNGSPTDRFHWEDAGPCIDPIEPGLFMQMQVDREKREGTSIYDGHADYLRPLPANGNFDLYLRGDTIRGTCPFGGEARPYILDDRLANPLTGNHEQEMPLYDRDGDGALQRGHHWVPGTRIHQGRMLDKAVLFGRPEHAFRMNGKRKLGMGTNPSSANMLTLVGAHGTDMHQGGPPNVRVIHLNGISVELLAMAENGDATVRVRSGDTLLEEDVRWCADSIVLPPLRGYDGHALVLAPGRTLVLDRSGTPTRLDKPERAGGQLWYSKPTRFTVASGSRMWLKRGSTLELRNGSEVHLMPGSLLKLEDKAAIKVRSGRVVLNGDARIDAPRKVLKRLRVVRLPG
ncbi:MAG: hypothetical protein KIT10_11640 [Flavobacteriales bacterium]|nr:hypothetical protein [Flavobacteriales bacterium]